MASLSRRIHAAWRVASWLRPFDAVAGLGLGGEGGAEGAGGEGGDKG